MLSGVSAAPETIEQVEELAQDLMRRFDILGGSKIQEDISYGQYKVLSVIHNQGQVSIGNLGRIVGSAQSTTSEMVARLTKAGLVTKVRGPYDGRVVMVELTEQGRQLMTRRRKRVRESYQRLFDRLSTDEQNGFTESLKNLVEFVGRATD